MAKIINLIFVLFLYTNALAQIGGTRATTDTMRLADKFAVYKIALGQRLDASKANTDTIQVTALLDVPEGGLPTCEASRQGNLMMNTSNNRLYFCNGTSWGLVAYDADLDGLTSAIDANEAVAFTAGTAAASNVMSGFTFYTGAGMTETTGSIPTYGGALSNGGSISSGSYTPANFPFTLQTDDDYVDKNLTINNPTNLSASNVRVGVAIAGNTGTYPSAGNRLNGNTATTDISAGTVRTGYEGFQSDGTLVTGSIPTYGGSISPSGSISSGSYTPSSFPFTLQTDDDYVDKDLTINNPTNLSATNVRIGVAIAGNTGTYPSSGNRLNGNTATTDVTAATLLANNEGFQSDGTLITGSIPTYGGSISNGGSISSGSYTPANFPFTLQTDDDYVDKNLTINNPTNLSASNVRIGVAIAGNTGTYPSAANRLNGNTGTTDIIAGAVRTGYEGFQSDGTLVTGSIPTYGGALSNGGSISSGSYTPANFPFTLQTDDDYVDKDLTINSPTNLAAANIKNGVTIAGVTGSFMDGGSNGLADLYVAPGQPDSGAGRLENIYANQVPEYWGFYDRFGTLRIGQMPKFFGPLYSGASNLGLSGIDNDKYKTGNYVPNFSSGSYTINTKFIPTTYSLSGQTNESIYGRGSLVEEDIILKKDPNLVGSNILNTVSIFGVSGSIPTFDVLTQGGDYNSSSGIQVAAGGSYLLPFHFNTAGTYVTTDLTVNAFTGADQTIAGSSQILDGYDAYAANGSVIDGSIIDKGAGSFTADGSYTTGYAGYYSSISVDVVAPGTADTDAGGAEIRGGYEAWNSTGGLVDGTMVDQGGGTYNCTAGTSGSDLLATGNSYLTGDVRVNKVTSTATIDQGQTASSGPYKSVTCNSVSVEAHSGISGAADTGPENVKAGETYYGTSNGSSFSKKTGTASTTIDFTNNGESANFQTNITLSSGNMTQVTATAAFGSNTYKVGCSSCVQTYTVTGTGDVGNIDGSVRSGNSYYRRTGNDFAKSNGTMSDATISDGTGSSYGLTTLNASHPQGYVFANITTGYSGGFSVKCEP